MPKPFAIPMLAVVASAALFAAGAARAEDIAWDKVIGASPGKLTKDQKALVTKVLLSTKNTRGCAGTIAACLSQGDLVARRHAGFVVRMAQKGKAESEIADGIKKRAESAFLAETMKVDVSGRARRGPADAKVTVVEFACFECPFCAHLAPQLKDLEKRFGGKVAHYYKFFPVRSHKRGVPTALAGLAALRQGEAKFWALHDLMYANRTALGDAELLGYAGKAGLDVAKFQADLKDPALMKELEKDKLEGMRLGVEGTPAFFINGKLYLGSAQYEELLDRIAEELDIAAGKIK